MYLPQQFTENNREKIIDLVNSNPFGMLIANDQKIPSVSHFPFLFEPNNGKKGTLIGHMAKANEQWQSLMDVESVIVVFSAANGYISPSLYSSPSVPTWNYAVAHLHGKLLIIDDAVSIERILEKQTNQFESNCNNPWQLNFPIEKHKLLQMIVGIEIEVQQIEGKFKLSQNKTLSRATKYH